MCAHDLRHTAWRKFVAHKNHVGIDFQSQIPLRYSWFEAGSKLVADRFQAGRQPA